MRPVYVSTKRLTAMNVTLSQQGHEVTSCAHCCSTATQGSTAPTFCAVLSHASLVLLTVGGALQHLDDGVGTLPRLCELACTASADDQQEQQRYAESEPRHSGRQTDGRELDVWRHLAPAVPCSGCDSCRPFRFHLHPNPTDLQVGGAWQLSGPVPALALGTMPKVKNRHES